MRRLVGLIALLALILGAAWLARIDFDLTRIAEFDTLLKPAGMSEATKAPSGEPSQTSDTTKSESDVSIVSGESDSQSPPADTQEMAVGKPMPDDFDPTEPLRADIAAASAGGGTAAATAGAEGEGTAGAPPLGIVPAFDIVRVEPTGETVIAGVAAPEAMVEVLNGDDPVATAEANARGEWALVLEAPLPPGTHDLAIRTTSPDRSQVTLSDQRVAVSVPETTDEEPLVVLNQPNAPSRVIQVPSEAAPGSEVAATQEPQSEAMAGTSDAVQPAVEPSAPAETEVAAAPQQQSIPLPSGEGASDGPTPAAGESGTMAPAEPTRLGSGSTATGEAEELPESSTAMKETAGAAASPTTSSTAEVSSTGAETAATEPPTPSEPAAPAVDAAPPPVTPEVGVAAVEAESNGTLYIAGTATTPEPVRVYIDDELVGEASPTEGGTWLVETEREMAPAGYTVRVDQVDAGSGAVIARAEVPFEREIEVAALKPVGEAVDPGSAEIVGSVADPVKVIIKRGDNLWRISRKLYGHGIRYSTIYQANRDQIRSPHRIYPGQVFVMPTGDAAWDPDQ
jgi:nucleoid-associated protein YgaU